MAAYTTTDFLSSVRARGSIPTTSNSSNVNNTTNLLAMASEELHIKLLPLILSVREEFYVARVSYSITADQATYAIPSRATGVILRDVQIINGTTISSLEPVDSEQITTTSTGKPIGYYLEHNNVVLYPTPATTEGTLKLRYFARPGRLAATTSCAQISSIDTNANTVTVATIPSSWAANTVVDFVKATPPYYNPGIDYTITNVVGTVISFTTLPTDIAANDWLAPAEYSPIPQLPYEFHPVLSQMTVVKALEAIGDREGAKAAGADLELLKASAVSLISPRVQGAAKKAIARSW